MATCRFVVELLRCNAPLTAGRCTSRPLWRLKDAVVLKYSAVRRIIIVPATTHTPTMTTTTYGMPGQALLSCLRHWHRCCLGWQH